MAYFEHFKYTGFSGVNVKDGVVRFGVQLSAAMDSDQSNTVAIYTRGATPALYFWNGTTETGIGAAGTGGVTTWDSLYDLDKSLTIDSTTLTFAGTHASGDVVTFTNATGSGDCIQITNSGSGYDIEGTSGTWYATKTGTIVAGRFVLGDSELITLGASGSSDSSIQWDGDSLNISGATEFDSTMVVAGSAGSNFFTLTAGDVVLSDGSVAITDADNAATLSITNDTFESGDATTALFNINAGSGITGTIFQITADAATTGNVLDIDIGDGGLTGGGLYISCNDDDVDEFSVGQDGATIITGVDNDSVGLTIVGVQTSEDTMKITSSGVTASNYAQLLINPSGAMAAGSNCFRIAPSGTPVLGSYGIEFVGAGKVMQAAYLDCDSTSSAVTINVGGALADNNAALYVTNDNAAGIAAGSSLVYIYGGTGAAGATAYGLEINCDGSNLEGLWVNAGATVLDESLSVGTTSTLTGAVTCTAGVQAAAVSRTATPAGTGTGTIADGTTIVDITAGTSSDAIVILPTPTTGNVVWLITEATATELRSSSPTTVAINGGTASAAESALAASTLTRCTCTSATTWICSVFGSSAIETPLEVAA